MLENIIFYIIIYGMAIIYITILIKSFINFILRKFFGYYKTVEYGKPNRLYHRRSYQKKFHWNFFESHDCFTGHKRFGTYYTKHVNGYVVHDTLTIPKIEHWEEPEYFDNLTGAI